MKDEAYSVADVAKLLRYSRRTIVRLFENEPGVIIKPGKRRTLRIPRAVYHKVVYKLMCKSRNYGYVLHFTYIRMGNTRWSVRPGRRSNTNFNGPCSRDPGPLDVLASLDRGETVTVTMDD